MTDDPRRPAESRTRARVRAHLARTLAGGAAGALVACESGCVVCDPLPPPSVCPADGGPLDLAANTDVRAYWESVRGETLARITVWVREDRGGEFELAGDPVLEGAVLVERVGGPQSFRLRVDPHATRLGVAVAGTCDGAPSTLALAFDVSGARTAGEQIPRLP